MNDIPRVHIKASYIQKLMPNYVKQPEAMLKIYVPAGRIGAIKVQNVSCGSRQKYTK